MGRFLRGGSKMSALIDKLKKKLEKDIEVRMTPILQEMKEMNKELKKISEEIAKKSQEAVKKLKSALKKAKEVKV